MQYRHPRQRCGISPTTPVAGSRSTACCGHTWTHGVSWLQCRHMTGTKPVRWLGYSSPLSTLWTRSHVKPLRSVAPSCAGGTLFSTAQATMQAPHPLQRSTSMVIPYLAACIGLSSEIMPVPPLPGRRRRTHPAPPPAVPPARRPATPSPPPPLPHRFAPPASRAPPVRPPPLPPRAPRPDESRAAGVEDGAR